MVTKTRKPAARKSAGVRSKTGAGAALAERSKDAAKPTFGKAAPKKVIPSAAEPTARAVKAAPKSAKSAKASSPSLATKIAHVATGAVVATARGAASLAASVVGKEGAKNKSKAK
jgi:large subunit ribosomal protein L23Ae